MSEFWNDNEIPVSLLLTYGIQFYEIKLKLKQKITMGVSIIFTTEITKQQPLHLTWYFFTEYWIWKFLMSQKILTRKNHNLSYYLR